MTGKQERLIISGPGGSQYHLDPLAADEQRTPAECLTGMAIDVLSDQDSAPIIVGDVVDMSDLQGITCDPEGCFYLHLNGQKVALSAPASENFRMAGKLLLVSISEGQISKARKVRIDNLDAGEDLTADQREALTRALSLGVQAPRQFQTEALAEFRRTNPELTAA